MAGIGLGKVQADIAGGKTAMKIKSLAGAVAATAIMFSVGAVAPASAINNIKDFGVQETLRDFGLGTEIGYTVTGLMPTADAVPFPAAGRLFEATVTAEAIQGTVTPVVSFFNARPQSSANYRVLTNVSSLSGAPLGQGGSTTGKIYFDVVGDVPNSVVYNNGVEDLLGWVRPPDPAPLGGSATDSSGGGDGGAAPAEVPGSTGPNVVSPPDTAGDEGGDSGTEGTDPPEGFAEPS